VVSSRRGSKMNILYKKLNFQHSMTFKLLSLIQGNTIKIVIFLKFIISAVCSNCDSSPWVPKILTIPLLQSRYCKYKHLEMKQVSMTCWYSCTELYVIIREECELDSHSRSHVVILYGEGTPPFYLYDFPPKL